MTDFVKKAREHKNGARFSRKLFAEQPMARVQMLLPVAHSIGRNGADRARARLILARRSEPLRVSTVLAPVHKLATGGTGGMGGPILRVGFE